MATAPRAFWRGELPAEETIIYTTPATGQAIVTDVIASNLSNVSAMISLKIAGVPALANIGIAPNGVLSLRLSQVLEPGDSISVQGNSATAYAHVSGVEVV
ncbi:hypothetical protein [Streptomyces prasinus]|uniref:hypothetical protein n=1 Tax=Streptomyces prasinus TaxID=67345 RepID=UPI0033BAC3F8